MCFIASNLPSVPHLNVSNVELLMPSQAEDGASSAPGAPEAGRYDPFARFGAMFARLKAVIPEADTKDKQKLKDADVRWSIRKRIETCESMIAQARDMYDKSLTPLDVLNASERCEQIIKVEVQSLATELRLNHAALPNDQVRGALKIVGTILGLLALAALAIALHPVVLPGLTMGAIVAMSATAKVLTVASAGAGGAVIGTRLKSVVERDFDRMHDRVTASCNAALRELDNARKRTIDRLVKGSAEDIHGAIDFLVTAASERTSDISRRIVYLSLTEEVVLKVLDSDQTDRADLEKIVKKLNDENNVVKRELISYMNGESNYTSTPSVSIEALISRMGLLSGKVDNARALRQ